ncbi:hypothetical protein ACVWXS_004389 [Lysinibacillus sp. TE18511]
MEAKQPFFAPVFYAFVNLIYKVYKNSKMLGIIIN